MVAAFAGLTRVLNSVFGSPVTFLSPVGVPFQVQAVFREEPVEMLQPDGGSVLDLRPMVRVPQSDAGSIQRGWRCQPGNGNTYRVLNRLANGEPAADRFVMFELELDA